MANQLYKGDKPLATFAPQIADNLTTDDSTKALSAKQGKVLSDRVTNDEKIINIGGNYFALALNNGNINITIPLNGNNNYSQVTLSKSSNINGSIYGSKVASPCTVSMSADILNDVVRLTLTPSVTLSICTDLAKGFMFSFGEKITATLS